MKILIATALICIVAVLALAGVVMLRGGGDAKPGNMMRVLALRVTLSVLLVAFILLSYWMGWIRPTGIPLG